MANYVGGDKWVPHTEYVTATANLCAKTLVTWAGAVPANAANSVMGVVPTDTKSGDSVSVKTGPALVEVIATGTVTKGAYVEVLYHATAFYGDIDGTSTVIPASGVTNHSSGYVVGRAFTGGSANDTVLIYLDPMNPATAAI
jgi:hypothetical protein